MIRHPLICLIWLTLLLRPGIPQTAPDASAPVSAPAPTPVAPATDSPDPAEENPEGYYAFMESPNATPPRVRPPPYRQVAAECSELEARAPHVSAANLCGDLNRGTIPRNPMRQNPGGEPYPFELFRNHTLRFLSRTLPVLRADDTVPRVTTLTHIQHNSLEERSKRSAPLPSSELPVEHRAAGGGAAVVGGGTRAGRGGPGVASGGTSVASEPRDSRKFCDEGGVFCMLYRAFNGNSEPAAGAAPVERREDPGHPHAHPQHSRYDGPPTPCPARVEYATPVFARNYQGVWRYVVQIPYEGYFTQTVEVTRCMSSRCHYLEGGCLSSPRWVSLLVAELHYPAHAPDAAQPTPNPQDFQSFSTEGAPSTDKPPHCDGHDDMGCFQVRLYYDWFLVPGSCKCWRPDYFARYVRRRQNNEL